MAIGGRWTRSAGSLTYISPSSKPRGGSLGLVLLSIAIAAFGILIMVMAGSQMLDGDFTSTSTSRKSGWITPPIAFGLGVLLSLSPFAIWLQEKRLRPAADVDGWRPVVTLRPEWVSLPEWPPHGPRVWGDVTETMLADVPAGARAVVEHYRDHPEDRAEIGSPTSLARADRTSS